MISRLLAAPPVARISDGVTLIQRLCEAIDII